MSACFSCSIQTALVFSVEVSDFLWPFQFECSALFIFVLISPSLILWVKIAAFLLFVYKSSAVNLKHNRQAYSHKQISSHKPTAYGSTKSLVGLAGFGFYLSFFFPIFHQPDLRSRPLIHARLIWDISWSQNIPHKQEICCCTLRVPPYHETIKSWFIYLKRLHFVSNYYIHWVAVLVFSLNAWKTHKTLLKWEIALRLTVQIGYIWQ